MTKIHKCFTIDRETRSFCKIMQTLYLYNTCIVQIYIYIYWGATFEIVPLGLIWYGGTLYRYICGPIGPIWQHFPAAHTKVMEIQYIFWVKRFNTLRRTRWYIIVEGEYILSMSGWCFGTGDKTWIGKCFLKFNFAQNPLSILKDALNNTPNLFVGVAISLNIYIFYTRKAHMI